MRLGVALEERLLDVVGVTVEETVELSDFEAVDDKDLETEIDEVADDVGVTLTVGVRESDGTLKY